MLRRMMMPANEERDMESPGARPSGPYRALQGLAGSALELDGALQRQASGLLRRLERHHPASYAHSLRVARLTLAMWHAAPERLGCGATALLGSALHDVGKLYVPAACLASQSPLSAQERHLVHAHAAAGASLLATLGFPPAIIEVAAHHHERWDGGGYPTGRPAAEFAPIVRAVAAADALAAMTEPGRSYRTPLTRDAARQELLACRGSQFDPQAVDILLDIIAAEAKPRARPHARMREGGATRDRMTELLDRVRLVPPGRDLAPAGS